MSPLHALQRPKVFFMPATFAFCNRFAAAAFAFAARVNWFDVGIAFTAPVFVLAKCAGITRLDIADPFAVPALPTSQRDGGNKQIVCSFLE